MAGQFVYLIETDISRYVSAVPDVAPAAGEYGQVNFTALPSITGNNRDGFWDAENTASPFYGTAPESMPLRIENDGVTTFEGYINQITLDGTARTAAVSLRSIAQDALESGAVYVSDLDTSTTPAGAARELCNLYKIPINTTSFARSEAVYAADLVYCSVRALNPDTTISTIIQQLAEIGVARLYWEDGLLHYEVYEEPTTDPITTFVDDPTAGITLWSRPNVETMQKSRIDGYAIEWVGNPVASFGPTAGNRRTISAGADSPVRIMSLQAAVWIGERWMEYLNRVQQRVTFTAPSRIAKSLRIGYPISIDTAAWGMASTVDIVALDHSQRIGSIVTGVTR